jgi:hypothetical protein
MGCPGSVGKIGPLAIYLASDDSAVTTDAIQVIVGGRTH